MKLNWKTIENTQAARFDHSWEITLTGYPEVKYLEDLLKLLGTIGKSYRIINRNTKQRWYVCPTKAPVYAIHKCHHVYDLRTGDVFVTNGEKISILIYKND